MSGFTIKKNQQEEYYFELKAANGVVIATGNLHRTLAGCENSIASVCKNADFNKIEYKY